MSTQVFRELKVTALRCVICPFNLHEFLTQMPTTDNVNVNISLVIQANKKGEGQIILRSATSYLMPQVGGA